MSIADLTDWIQAAAAPGALWYVKRLAANDTLAAQSHQAGPYVPKQLLFEVFPTLNDETRQNPDVLISASVDSHSDERQVRAVWYNNRLFGGTRNEARITNWGGAASAVLAPDSTGALAVFAFQPDGSTPRLRTWICRNAFEEGVLEDRFGPVEPGALLVWRISESAISQTIRASAGLAPCRLRPDEIPQAWVKSFPSGIEIVRYSVERRPLLDQAADERLVKRRDCEYQVFLSVEEAVEGPRIADGFSSVGQFVAHAHSVLQRRKSRSGRSLELQTRQILLEEGFEEGVSFSHQPESEHGKRPDFLFPCERAYKDAAFNPEFLRLLAAKTTCKDRWRQVINEADRIPIKHLLTLQEGVSEGQFAEMRDAGVQLVVPAPLIESYPENVRPHLMTLAGFINEVTNMPSLSSST